MPDSRAPAASSTTATNLPVFFVASLMKLSQRNPGPRNHRLPKLARVLGFKGTVRLDLGFRGLGFGHEE